MRKKAIYQFLLVALVAMGVVAQAQAHRMWILPSATVLSGDTPYVTFDAAVSNAIFFPDHVSLRLDQLTVNAPDGEQVAVENVSRGRYRSTFDLPLSQEGTYKVSIAMAGYAPFGKMPRASAEGGPAAVRPRMTTTSKVLCRRPPEICGLSTITAE